MNNKGSLNSIVHNKGSANLTILKISFIQNKERCLYLTYAIFKMKLRSTRGFSKENITSWNV